MPSRTDNPTRNETFGRLLSGAINSIATYEGKTAPIVEEGLGQLLNLSGKTIQRYKAGHLPPEDRTVEILAEAAVQRGYLGREWLGRFLHAARYPFADKLLDRLCPIGPARPRPPRVYHNLPAPTYSQFVMRAQAFADVIDGLRQRSAVALIVGLGGNGKTSLAREVAAQCLMEDGDMPRFDAVVWVSDKDRPGTTNLSLVLDEIARTLDYPGFTQFAHDEKLYEVGQLLKRQRVLVVIDNFETINDGVLLSWLLRLPEPSKALITSRERHRGLWSSWLAELRGMSESEAQALIHQRLRMLQLDKLARDPLEFEPLVVVTGGNPKAIEIALGLVKHERRPLQQVVDDLYAARGDLFDDLFTRAWALLDEAARRVLLVMTFFPASASGDALSATADVQGFFLDRVIERLTDLALLDVQQEDLNSPPRYALHPLVRAFAKVKLAAQSHLENEARERWVNWIAMLADQVGLCFTDLGRLGLLDDEHETVFDAIAWLMDRRQYGDVLRIIRGIEYYFDVRGLWNRRRIIHQWYIEAAQALEDYASEARAIALFMLLLYYQDDISAAEKWIPRLYELMQKTQLDTDTLFDIHNIIALTYYACQEYEAAEKMWQDILPLTSQASQHAYISCRQMLARCSYRQGDREKARRLFTDALQDATKYGYVRRTISLCDQLALMKIDENKPQEAVELLDRSLTLSRHYLSRRHIAAAQRIYARLYMLRSDRVAAIAALREAIDLLERLGMRRELTEARAELADLEARELTEAVR